MIAAAGILITFFALFCCWIYFRFIRTLSKGRFSLVVISTIFAGFISVATIVTSNSFVLSVANWTLSTINFLFSAKFPPINDFFVDFYAKILLAVIFLVTLYFVYKLSEQTLKHWDGPTTMQTVDLETVGLHNNIVALGRAELVRLISGRPDPEVGDYFKSWERQVVGTPASPSWNVFARDLYLAAFAEARLPEDGWKDSKKAWAGTYDSGASTIDTLPLWVFVLGSLDDRDNLDSYISEIKAQTSSRTIFVGVYEGKDACAGAIHEIAGEEISFWSSNSIMIAGLKLSGYARSLIDRFDKDPLAGTDKTLRDTFVPTYVYRADVFHWRLPLAKVLKDWAGDNSRRQLAIVGDYGQGKSTAMLEWCASWAHRFLAGQADGERIPLFIELRGQNPSNVDPLAFLAGWAGKFAIPPKQLLNLIKAGEVFLIFEGFDELQNSGRSFDRYEHFNALWSFCYPGTKLIFTGRPNFFISEKEKNTTLRSTYDDRLTGVPFTELYEISELRLPEISKALKCFGKHHDEIITYAKEEKKFLEIIERPSMLPVVVTIWPQIKSLLASNESLTGAIMIEQYLRAVYLRKERELNEDQIKRGAPDASRYLKLPWEVRDLLSMLIVRRMNIISAQNTISRIELNRVVSEKLDEVIAYCKSTRSNSAIAQRVADFEERFKHSPRIELASLVSNEVASGGIFVVDSAGGDGNLKLPHKQFYEFILAKGIWISLAREASFSAKLLRSISRGYSEYSLLVREVNSVNFFVQIVGDDIKFINTFSFRGFLYMYFSVFIFEKYVLSNISYAFICGIRFFSKDNLVRFIRFFTDWNKRISPQELEKMSALSDSQTLSAVQTASALQFEASAQRNIVVSFYVNGITFLLGSSLPIILLWSKNIDFIFYLFAPTVLFAFISMLTANASYSKRVSVLDVWVTKRNKSRATSFDMQNYRLARYGYLLKELDDAARSQTPTSSKRFEPIF